MKVVFMGTPDFAVASLDALYQAGHEIVLCVTQPDKPRGRKGDLVPSEVKEYAIAHDIPVFQPERIRLSENVEHLRSFPADVFVVAAYGQILPKEILEMPRLGCVNVHASLLPKYRGAAPIQWSILNGDEVTGVTTMQMGVGLDDGDILLKEEVVIDPEITGGELFDKLSVVGGELIVRTIEELDQGKITPIPQNEAEATHVGMLKKSMGALHFDRDARELKNYVRGLNPWPSAYTFYQGKMLKIWKADVVSDTEFASDEKVADHVAKIAEDATAGQILLTDESGIYVKTGDGILVLKEVQLEGKKRMQVADFLRGNPVEVGDAFTEER